MKPTRTFSTLLGMAVLLAGCGEESQVPGGQSSQPPPPVEVATPLVKSIVEWDEYTGRFEAVERVEIRARISGYLDSIHFRDGQIVGQGDLLYVIDPNPFEAALEGARAELERARSALSLARTELARAERLTQSRAISREDLDIRRAAQQQAEASVAAARATARAAELNLEFTRIKAPIAGRISDSKVDVGNLVTGGSGDSTLLTTIVALDPIYFVFDASEADFLRYIRLHREGSRPSSREVPNPVFVRLMDESEWNRRGRMDFVDNEVNLASGTMRARAVLDNPDLFLTPGVFGRLRLVGSGEYQAMLIPDTAIVSDQSRKVVMTVDAEGVVIPRGVELGPMVEGLRVIRRGIGETTRVVVRGILRARPGARVTIEETQIVPSARAAGFSSPGPEASGWRP